MRSFLRPEDCTDRCIWHSLINITMPNAVEEFVIFLYFSFYR